MLLFLSAALLVAPLLIHMIEARRTGQNRPSQYPLAPQVRQAVQRYIDQWPAVNLMTQGRDSVEPKAGITILLMSNGALPPEFEEGLVRAIYEVRGDKPVVNVFPLLTARQTAPPREGLQK